ncbi:helix-turn-helix domain-containing protein [Lactococcus garvieae]|uniref:helix-turn-helix domain-containing protein n=1 Tax=Lactococcus garvieae TaxID=1363 RepID=UPI00254FAD1A|nr:helix-turn-helix transcriptional regulator [Lactococcus garvieae]
MKKFSENFRDNIVRLRKERGMTQQELADDLEINKQQLSEYERGKRTPNFEVLDRIASYFQASPVQLFGTEQERQLEISAQNIDDYDKKAANIILAMQKLNDNYYLIEELTEKNNVADILDNGQLLYRYKNVETGGTYVTTSDTEPYPDYSPSLLERIEKLSDRMGYIVDNQDMLE